MKIVETPIVLVQIDYQGDDFGFFNDNNIYICHHCFNRLSKDYEKDVHFCENCHNMEFMASNIKLMIKDT